ncbi:portal protein [Streptomyces phage Aaronocolus]|uniref:Portal protein n=7 Tax=Likavirus aaronocolus TaxID=1982884 RepID=A0A411CVB9_9CAUD|nr:portal protein [Streptomyces phage Aaronocolus]ATE85187.1 portal protein [Streptomyces phage Esperer]QAY17210.1 portal protein [Streptomyces phage Bovely]QAY17283.1 portal protein [Streptomyces phage Indigo]QAY17825.1 portal protein [Streptomyces phage Nerdos]QDK03372.1 portal protein [Streptomyces phage Leviticus]QGJ91524.1 portal protein [Streptomyces phage Phettuccine]
MADTSPASLAKKLLSILDRDSARLERIDDYLHGNHDDPYMPPQADDEYRLLAKRAVSNWTPLLVNTPAQALYVDGFRPSKAGDTLPQAAASTSSEWEHWQRSRLDARQAAVYKGALTYGHSFTVTEKDKKGHVVTKGLSPRRTSALFEDPANDDTPYAALTVTVWPKGEAVGKARMWDGSFEYAVTFKSLGDEEGVKVVKGKRHGASECPVTRFAASVDLDGRTIGVIEPMIPLQNRINQSVFDLLVAQTYTSHEVRYATGMAPPIQRDPETGDPILDENGQPKPIPMNHNARRFLFAEDPDVKFGSLPGGPIGSLIDSIDMSIRHLAAVSQTPPHHLLGQIANLSAEALLAAETALSRKIAEFRAIFGESWERVFRLAAELSGSTASADDFAGEVIWRDMESRSLAQAADALGKLKEQLGIPAKGLWKRVPGVTQTEFEDWEDLAETEDAQLALATSIRRATPESTTSFSTSSPEVTIE